MLQSKNNICIHYLVVHQSSKVCSFVTRSSTHVQNHILNLWVQYSSTNYWREILHDSQARREHVSGQRWTSWFTFSYVYSNSSTINTKQASDCLKTGHVTAGNAFLSKPTHWLTPFSEKICFRSRSKRPFPTKKRESSSSFCIKPRVHKPLMSA